MSISLAIGTVAYYPPESTFHRFSEIRDELRLPLYVFDNSPEISVVREWAAAASGVAYLCNEENVGLGAAMAALCTQAKNDGMDYLLFFDQDTRFTQESIKYALRIIEQEKNLQNYSCIQLAGKSQSSGHKIGGKSDVDIQDVRIQINSGSLFLLANVAKVGGHDKTYFVDGVDYKFCLDSAKMGYRLGRVDHVPGLDHLSDQGALGYGLFLKRRYVRKYSLTRMADSAQSSARLIVTAIVSARFDYALIFFRLIVLYLAEQCLVRATPNKCSRERYLRP